MYFWYLVDEEWKEFGQNSQYVWQEMERMRENGNYVFHVEVNFMDNFKLFHSNKFFCSWNEMECERKLLYESKGLQYLPQKRKLNRRIISNTIEHSGLL